MKRKTAAELLAELETDPEWTERRASRELDLARRAAAAAEDEQELVREIRAAGYDIDSVYDLVNNVPHPVLPRRFIGPYPAAYPILVHHLSFSHTIIIREGIVRALTVKDGGIEVENALFAAFKAEASPKMRWVLANALRSAMPYHRRRKHPDIAVALESSP